MGALAGRGLPSRLGEPKQRLMQLKTVRPGGTPLGPGRGGSSEASSLRRSKDWLNTARWQRLRLKILDRDGWRCQQTGVMLIGRHPAPDSPVVDHKVPHRGNAELFWDEANLQAVSKAWHDSVKQSLEKGGRIGKPHPDWLKPSSVALTIVCGPPASGKSTWVQAAAEPDDLVIDLDAIASRMAGTSPHAWPKDILGLALWQRNELLASLSRPSRHPRAWFIVSEPLAERRAWWVGKLEPQRVVVLATPAKECRRRAAQDLDRDQSKTAEAIEMWWRRYSPRRGEDVVQ